MADLKLSCAERITAVAECDSEEACAHAHLGLILCMASKVCTEEAAKFEKLLEANVPGAQNSQAFDDMQACMGKFSQAARAAAAAPPAASPSE
jgi:hypothetical protein